MKKEDEKSKFGNFEDLIDEWYGPVGTVERDELERGVANFRVGSLISFAREDQHLTQSQLAERVGMRREYISRVENDANNITLKSLRKIVEQGLGGKLRIEIDFEDEKAKPEKKNGAHKNGKSVAV